MGLWAMYVDESGDDEPCEFPPAARTPTPLFVITGLILPLHRWPQWDRDYLGLKRWFFPKEIALSRRLILESRREGYEEGF